LRLDESKPVFSSDNFTGTLNVEKGRKQEFTFLDFLVVGVLLWAYCCVCIVVGVLLWAYCCGRIVVDVLLWAYCCGRIVVGALLFYKFQSILNNECSGPG